MQQQPDNDPDAPRELRNPGGRKAFGTAPNLLPILPTFSNHSVWSSPEQFAKHVEGLNPKDAWHQGGWENGDDFAGCSMQEAIKMARSGWPEGAKAVESMRSKIQARFPLQKRQVKYDVAGAFPHIPRAVAGEFKNMRQIDNTLSKKKPIITLFSDMCAAWYIKHQTVGNRAAALAAIIDIIENNGYTCEVISAAITHGYSSHRRKDKNFSATVSVIIKAAGQPVDVARLAFGLGHAGMFRRMVFAEWGRDSENSELGDGLGCVETMYPEDQKAMAEEHKVYYVPSAQDNSKYFKEEETTIMFGVQLLVNHLRKLGCPAFPKWDDEAEKQEKEMQERMKDKKNESWW